MMEDIFSEELVDAPDDIEHVIEGGADEIRDGSGRESGNEEANNENESAKDKDKVKVKRKLGPRPTLNAQRLKGPRGIGIMESFFSDIKLQGKGKEKEDLDLIMGRLEHWAHRLFPRMQFDEALQKIEKLGSKKEVSNYLKRIRLGLEDDEVTDTGVVDEPPDSPPPQLDSFDQLMASIPTQPAAMEMTEEQRERMLQNRLIAEERRNARLKRAKELKEKFQANQAQSQTEDGRKSETKQGGTNENNDAEINNQHELEMEIDENIINENDSDFDGKHVGGLMIRDAKPDLQAERKENKEVPMEGVNNYPDILMENNNAQPGCSQENVNSPDIVQRNSQAHNSRESDVNQPDILSIQQNLPDILVGRNEIMRNENQAFGPLGRLDVQTDNVRESGGPRHERGNHPDVLQ